MKRERQKVTGCGFWQGAHWRRSCRIIPVAFVLLVIFSTVSKGRLSFSGVPATLGCIAVVFLAVEWALGRKMGFQISDDALVLCGPLRRVRIPWSKVQGFAWHQRRSRTKTNHLYVETDQKVPRRFPRDAPVRVPSVACVFDFQLPNDRLLGPLLTSPCVRSRDGREVEAMELLESARLQAVARGVAKPISASSPWTSLLKARSDRRS